MKQCVFCLAFLALLITSSCKKQGTILTDNEIGFDTIRSVKTYFLDNDSTKPSCNLKLVLVYPVKFADSGVLDSVQRIITSVYIGEEYSQLPINDAFSKFTSDYVENYKEDAETFYNEERLGHEDPDEYFSYFETITNQITFNKDDLIAFQINDSGRKASNNSSFLNLKNYVIDLTNGKLIEEEDIFTAEYKEAFTKIFQNYLMKANDVQKIDKLEDLGFYGLDEIVPNNNFLLDNKGITYIFNKGEYSIPKKEPIEIFIPYKDIRTLLRDESPISKYFEN